MNKIKSLSLALVAVVGLSALALAAKSPNNVETPRNQMGQEAHPENAGWLHKRQSATAEMIVCEGRCLLKALILNTGPRTTEVRVRNSSVANGAGALVIKHKFEQVNTAPGNNPIAAPILLDKGITVSMTAASTEEEVEVLYRDLD